MACREPRGVRSFFRGEGKSEGGNQDWKGGSKGCVMVERLEFPGKELGLFCFALGCVETLMCHNQGCVTSSVLSF